MSPNVLSGRPRRSISGCMASAYDAAARSATAAGARRRYR